jgi:hypothetical protein
MLFCFHFQKQGVHRAIVMVASAFATNKSLG